jgi:hypothetical protein
MAYEDTHGYAQDNTGTGPDHPPSRGNRAEVRADRRGRNSKRRHRARRGHPAAARPRTSRRALRREVPGTVGVLADAYDFDAMRGYRTFVFDDHRGYLRSVEDLLRSRTAGRLHTDVVLFDPQDFTDHCVREGLDPDNPASRADYTAALAGRGDVVAYTGQPLDDLLPRLVDNAVRRAVQEYASSLLVEIGACAHCGQDIGRAAFDRACHLLTRLLEEAGPGAHHLVCSVLAPAEHLLAVLTAEHLPTETAAVLDAVESTEFVTVLATAVALAVPGGIVLRTSTPGAPDRLHGWRLHQGEVVPLTEAEVFSAYCTDAATGEPVAPEPDVEYRAGFPVVTDRPDPHR